MPKVTSPHGLKLIDVLIGVYNVAQKQLGYSADKDSTKLVDSIKLASRSSPDVPRPTVVFSYLFTFCFFSKTINIKFPLFWNLR